MDQQQQEILFKLSMSEQHIRQLQQQLQAVEESMIELRSLDLGLDDIKDSAGKDMLASLGRGIFVKAKLLSEDLIVDVGSKNLVKKSIPETKKIIKDQTEKLHEVKKELEERVDEINKELTKLIFEAQEGEEI